MSALPNNFDPADLAPLYHILGQVGVRHCGPLFDAMLTEFRPGSGPRPHSDDAKPQQVQSNDGMDGRCEG